MNQYIDHTLLKPQAQKEDIIKLCKEAIDYKFKAVCVNSYYVSLASEKLKDSEVKVCTVVGFPLGASPTSTKVEEAKVSIEAGADEIDMVINIGALKDGDKEFVENDIKAVAAACHGKGKILKVIIETSLLTEEEKIIASQIVSDSKADFIKTSTGFAGGGATVEDVELMKANISADIQIKASGGVRTLEDAQKMIDAGATRIGASSGVAICEGKIGSGY